MLFIVIPVFNRMNFTRDCLNSLANQTFKKFKVIIVDDGSTDNTSNMLKHEFPDVKVISGDGNLFWTAATNLGIEAALKNNATSVMTLNNDVIAPPEFVERMIYWHTKMPKALLGALAIDNKSGEKVYGGEIIDWKRNTSTNLLKSLPREKQTGIHLVTHFPGRGLLIPVCVFKKIGLFNAAKFPHYYADYDFTSQARINGFEVFCNYDSPLITFPEASGDKNNRVNKSFKNYLNHLFGIKGGGNLKNFTLFTLRNCPARYVPYFLINGYMRRVFGYLIK